MAALTLIFRFFGGRGFGEGEGGGTAAMHVGTVSGECGGLSAKLAVLNKFAFRPWQH